MKKSGDKPAKKRTKKDDTAKRAKKRPRPEADGAAAAVAAGGKGGGGDAYDSGDEVVANEADKRFIDSDDDLADIAQEYHGERQDFRDERADGFEGSDEDDDRPKSRGADTKVGGVAPLSFSRQCSTPRKVRAALPYE